MADESSKKAMSLNQLHGRLFTASRTKPSGYSFLSEMKNREGVEENDVPSFNIDFDSPSSLETVEPTVREDKLLSTKQADIRKYSTSEMKNKDQDEENDVPSFNFTDFDSSSPPKTSTMIVNKDKFSSKEYIDDYEDSSSDEAENVPLKAMNEDEFISAEKSESSDSFGEQDSSVVDDLDSHHEGEKQQKVKLKGRRRLCKVVVKDDEVEDDIFDDVESDFPADDSVYDSPSPVKNTGNNQDGGDEIRDILSNLSSRFEFLSIEKGKRPSKQPSSSSDSVIRQKPVEVSEPVAFKKASVSLASKQSDSSLNATASGKDYTNGGYVKKEAGKTVSTESFIRPQKYKIDEDDDDDEDCVVTSGQKFVPKVEGRHGKSCQEFDDSNNVYTLNDDTNDSASGDDVPFSLSNPKFSYSLPSKIAKMLFPHQREGLKWLWSLHCKGKGGILGDDMGLGKTMQICGFLAGLFHSNLVKRVLVVAPKTLLPHWLKELGVVGLSRKTKEYFGTCAKARQYELQYVLQDKGILLTTYDIVRNNVKALSGDYDEDDDEVTWDYMILDEGHLIKNPSTQRAKSLLAIPCAHRIIISGTPLQNNLKELWALFNFCCPELLGDKKCFKDKNESLILRGNDKNASDRDKRIGSAVAQDLRKCIQPYFLRRLKNEVFRDNAGGTNTAKLSKKNEIIVWLKLSSCQVLMWRLLSTRTSVSQCGMSGVKTRFVHYGGIISRTHKVLSLWSTAMTGTELLRQEMNCTGC